MPAQFETISTAFQVSGVGPSITIAAPPGLALSDLMVAHGGVFGGSIATISVPAGWTLHATNGSTFPTGFVATKRATAQDIGANFVFSQDLGGSEAWSLGIYRLSGALGFDSNQFAFMSGDQNDILLPVITTIADNVLVLRAAHAVYATTEPSSITDPTGHTRRAFIGGPNNGGVADPFGIFYTVDTIKTPPGVVSAPSPQPQAVGRAGNLNGVGLAVGIAPDISGGGGSVGGMGLALGQEGEALSKGHKILNPFESRKGIYPSKRYCRCAIGKCTCM